MKKIIFLLCIFQTLSSNAQIWTQIATGSTKTLRDIKFLDADNGWVIGDAGINIGEYGLIQKTSNAGTSFTSQNTGYYNNNLKIAALNINTAWIVDGSINIRKTVDGGSNWTDVLPGPSPTFPYNKLNDIVFTDSNNGWTVGANGIIYKTSDGGSSWVLQTSGTARSLNNLFFVDSNVGFVVANLFPSEPQVLKTINGGITWSIISNPDPFYLIGSVFDEIYFINASTGFISNGGRLFKTINGGISWSNPIAISGQWFDNLFFTDSNSGWVSGTSGIYKTVDQGINWSLQLNFPSNQAITKLFFSDANHGWACGTGGLLFKYSNACQYTLSPTGTITTNQKAATTVISTGINTIPNASNVIYQGGNYVQLNTGFQAKSGAVFTAKILNGCL